MEPLYPKGPVTGLGNGYTPKKGPKPNDRSVFMYMAPKAEYQYKDEFAQCGPCRMRVPMAAMPTGDYKKGCDLCILLGSQEAITAGGSCGEFAPWPNPAGDPNPEVVNDHAHELAKGIPGSVTKEQVGYVERPVRCENCFFEAGDATICSLYQQLSLTSKYFKDSGAIEEYACCNSNTPKED